MIRKMTIKFEKTKEDFYQGTAVARRLNSLIEKYGDRVIRKIYKTKSHHYNEFDEKEGHWILGKEVYYDYVLYYNDSYEKTVMRALRPYYEV